jgi:hypothetical protein
MQKRTYTGYTTNIETKNKDASFQSSVDLRSKFQTQDMNLFMNYSCKI